MTPTLKEILDSFRPLFPGKFADMAKPLGRVLALLEILQAGGTRTLRELSGRLSVDERTVRRYVDHLLDLGVPVESVRGRYGGYRLAPGYRMPPLMLTDDEAIAVLLGLTGTRRAALRPDAAVAVESATAKVRRVLPRALASRLDALVAATSDADESRNPTTPETGVLLTVAEAAVGRRPLAITYRDKNDRSTERVLQPYGVVALRGRWYATGLDSRSGQVRSFRLDRIEHAVIQEGQFPVPAGFDPAAQVIEAVSGATYPHAVSVRVHGEEPVVRMRMPGSIATIEPVDSEPGWVRVRWRAERLDWVPSVLARLDRPFVIEEPDELRERVRALAGQLASWAEAR
jgi:predicted DNA-binding transcriptional regulator YafY